MNFEREQFLDIKLQEKILERISTKDDYNECGRLGGPEDQAREQKIRNEISNTFKVMVPHTKKTTRSSQIEQQNHNLRTMQQICANYNPKDAVPDLV